MAVFVNPETGERFENVPDGEAQTARTKFGLVTPEEYEYQQRSVGQKAIDTAATGFAGAAAIGGEIGKLIPESLGGLSDAEAKQADQFVQSAQVKRLREEHPVAFALGSNAPAMALGVGVGGIPGVLAESAAVGLGDEAISSTQEGREFDAGGAAEGAGTDLAFSVAAEALTGIAGRVGNLFLFGTGNTMARNLKRGLDEAAGPVVPDDVRFEGPLLEAETRSRRAAAAASPGMPPGPERDELLRRAAPDLNRAVADEVGDILENTATAARESASVTSSPMVQRRIEEVLTDTTPAQTAWSADATRRLDKMRESLTGLVDDPVVTPFVSRAQQTADEAIRAIDGAGDSASWFAASSRARNDLDELADELESSPLQGSVVAKAVNDARSYLAKSLSDRALFGSAAEIDSALRGAARDQIGAAAKASGGDLRKQLSDFVAAPGSERAALRKPLEQAIEGFEELARSHEKFGTATSRQIDALKENAATLRRGLTLADDIESATARGAERAAKETPESAARVESAAERLAEHLAADAGKKAISAGIGKALNTISDFIGVPGAGWVMRKISSKVGDKAAEQIIEAARQLRRQSGPRSRIEAIRDRMRRRAAQTGSVNIGGKGPNREAGTVPPKGKAKRPDGPVAAKPERDVLPTKFYPNSNAARNEYGEAMRPYREAQRADDLRAAALADEFSADDEAAISALDAVRDRMKKRESQSGSVILSGSGAKEVDREATRIARRLEGLAKREKAVADAQAEVDRLQNEMDELDVTSNFSLDAKYQSLEKQIEKAQSKLERAEAGAVRNVAQPALSDRAQAAIERARARAQQGGAVLVEDPDTGFTTLQRDGSTTLLLDAIKEADRGGVLSALSESDLEKLIGVGVLPHEAVPEIMHSMGGVRIVVDYPFELERTIRKEANGELSAIHGVFRLPSDLRGQGIAKKYLKDATDIYKKLGIKTIRIPQATEDGVVVWAKLGATGGDPEILRLAKDAGLPHESLESIARAKGGEQFLRKLSDREHRMFSELELDVNALSRKLRRSEHVDLRSSLGERQVQLGSMNLGAHSAGGGPNFTIGGVATSPMGVVTALGAAGVGANYLLRSEQQKAENDTVDRVLTVDDAASQRIRHTARVLAGLAEPPPPEGLTTALARFGEEHDDPRAAFEERKATLEKAEIAPALVYDVIGSALGDLARVSPELFQAASARLLEGFRYLRQNLPAEIKTSLLYPTGLPPSESAMRDWATQWNTVMDPESVLDDIERGTVTHLQVRTLQGAHPDIYQQMRTEIIAEVGANFADIPWSTKMQLDILFQADGLAGPMFSSRAAAMIGAADRAASKRKAPGPADVGGTETDSVASSSGLEAIRTSVTNRGV